MNTNRIAQQRSKKNNRKKEDIIEFCEIQKESKANVEK